MNVCEMDISPTQAAKWLAGQCLNRPLNMGVVKRYAADMADGRWMITHQAIAFDERGQLIDGQHRLQAVILFGNIVRMTVALGVARETFAVIDIGPNRTSKDLYVMKGGVAENAVARVAIARAMLQGADNKYCTREEVADYACKHAQVIGQSIAMLNSDAVRAWMTAPIRAAYAVKILECGIDVIRPIAEEQASGLYDSIDNPLKRLQDRMVLGKMQGRRVAAHEQFALTIKAIEFRLAGHEVSKLVFKGKRKPRTGTPQ